MANFIIKKDGTKEPFNPQKINNAVIAAAIEAGLVAEEVAEIAEEVSSTVDQSVANLNEVLGVEIMARVLSQLDAIAPIIANAWRKHDKKNDKKQSK